MKYLNATLIVTDLEATCWEDSPHDNDMEIIQIASIPLVVGRGRFVDEQPTTSFNEYVHPQVTSKLSDFCIELTGITQATVNKARYFPDVYDQWNDWLTQFPNPVFCSWGWYDYGQFWKDTNRFPGLAGSFNWPHINLKEYVYSKIGGRHMGTYSVLRRLGLPVIGRQHDAYSDVSNIVQIIKHVWGRG